MNVPIRLISTHGHERSNANVRSLSGSEVSGVVPSFEINLVSAKMYVIMVTEY